MEIFSRFRTFFIIFFNPSNYSAFLLKRNTVKIRCSHQVKRSTLVYVIKQLGSTNHILIFPLFKPFSSTLYSHSIFCYSYYTPIYPMRINLSEDKTSFCFLYSRSKRCSAKSSLESSIISSLLSNLSISSDKWFSSTWVYKSIVICNVA